MRHQILEDHVPFQEKHVLSANVFHVMKFWVPLFKKVKFKVFGITMKYSGFNNFCLFLQLACRNVYPFKLAHSLTANPASFK